jgi:glycerol-3-phosphate acyltransferase PlsY
VTVIVVVALIGYLLGSFPSGYIAGRIAGTDIRTVGSGNVGATNVTRTLGKRFGFPVFIVDFAKGVVAVVVARLLANYCDLRPDMVAVCVAVVSIAAVIGHSYPIWLRFRGGKGVATSIGILFGINWIAALAVCVVWLIVFQISRYVSLASLAAAIALPVAMATAFWLRVLDSKVLVYFSFCLAAIVIVRHRSNLSRLLNGTEPRFVRK